MAKFENTKFISLANLQKTLQLLATKLDARYVAANGHDDHIKALIAAGMQPTYDTLSAAATALKALNDDINTADTGLKALVAKAQSDATKALDTIGTIGEGKTVASELSRIENDVIGDDTKGIKKDIKDIKDEIGAGFSATNTIADKVSALEAAVGTTPSGEGTSTLVTRLNALEAKTGTDTDKVAAAQSTADNAATAASVADGKAVAAQTAAEAAQTTADVKIASVTGEATASNATTGLVYATTDTNKAVTIGATKKLSDVVTGWETFINSATKDTDALNYVDTLKEIQDFIGVNGEAASDFLKLKKVVGDKTVYEDGDVTYTGMQKDIDDLETIVGKGLSKVFTENSINNPTKNILADGTGYSKYAYNFTDAVDTLIRQVHTNADEISKINNASGEGSLANKVSTLEGKMNTVQGANTVDGSIAKAEKDAKDYADTAVSNFNTNTVVPLAERVTTLENAGYLVENDIKFATDAELESAINTAFPTA